MNQLAEKKSLGGNFQSCQDFWLAPYTSCTAYGDYLLGNHKKWTYLLEHQKASKAFSKTTSSATFGSFIGYSAWASAFSGA